jgi:hypothetical protein
VVDGDSDTDEVTAETKSEQEEARKALYGDQCAEITEADIRKHTAHLITLADRRQEKKEKYKIEKKARKGYIKVALEHLLANMNGQEGAVDSDDWYDQDDIPTSIRYNLWFGYVYLTLAIAGVLGGSTSPAFVGCESSADGLQVSCSLCSPRAFAIEFVLR